MEDQEEQGSEAATGSWTCEACGCHTNTEEANPQSCAICGIFRRDAGALAMRRGGVSAASRFLSRAYAIRRGMPRDDIPFDDVLPALDHFDDEDAIMQDDEAMAALALEVAGIRGMAVGLPGVGRHQQRVVEQQPVRRVVASRNLPRPDDLLRMAMANTPSYHDPKWADGSELGARMRGVTGFELGPGRLKNVALAPIGSGEGRTVRAVDALPRRPLTSSAQGTAESNQTESHKVFGFKVAFLGPRPQVGASMGGCYLVGVASASFTSFGERNALQQSPYFWGIEDGGSKFEGPASRQRGRSSSTSGVEMRRGEVPFNDSDMLFGSQEVLTVVVDTEHRSLTYWRDERPLGTLVTNLPRIGLLYPVAVPFNSDVGVAITDLNGDPLECLQQFQTHWKDEQLRRTDLKRQQVVDERQMYITKGKISWKLFTLLKQIFTSYVCSEDNARSESGLRLSNVDSARLWYRCGIRLRELNRVVERHGAQQSVSGNSAVSFHDFMSCIGDIVEADETDWSRAGPYSLPRNDFVIGDIVQLVDEFNKYGDAAEGPLELGERGKVVEVKTGTIGQKHIKVAFDGRTWWYRAHSLVTERSKLIDSAGVWLLRRLVRAHGYHSSTLQPIWGEPISSWQIGDFVLPKRREEDSAAFLCQPGSCFGRVARPQTSSVQGRRAKDIDIVQVEFIDPSFGVSTGVFGSSRLESAPSLHSRQMRGNKLVHARPCWSRLSSSVVGDQDIFTPDAGESLPCSSKELKDKLSGIELLHGVAIEGITEECGKNISVLSALFDAGLAGSILRALDCAERMLESGRETLSPLLALNVLLRAITDRLYPVEPRVAGEGAQKPSDKDSRSPPRTRSRSRVERGRRAREEVVSRRRGILSRLSSRSRVNSIDSQYDSSLALGPNNDSVSSQVGHSPLPETESALACFLRGRDFAFSHGEDGDIDVPVEAWPRTAVDALLLNSLPWLKGWLEPPSQQATSGVSSDMAEYCRACDDDGMSLLLLAIRFGCSRDVIDYLLRSGSSVGVEDITAAAVTNQCATLSILLRSWVYSKGSINTSLWPKDALAVFQQAEGRHKFQQKKVCEMGCELLASLLHRLCRFGQLCHRLQTEEASQCLRAISEALVGNPLLRKVSQAQETVISFTPSAQATPRLLSLPSSGVEVERVSLGKAGSIHHGPVSLSNGLLQVIPEDVFFKLTGNSNVVGLESPFVALLSFIESFLWSKDSSDAAIGLTGLLNVLQRAPRAPLNVELGRYAIHDMVSRHRAVAERALAAIHARKFSVASTSDSLTEWTSHTEEAGVCSGAVFCPKKHVAEFHITKHSSFRCDICGKGVDRGMPMHGCRTCDWDACERCTDKSDGGIAKWSHVLELASQCQILVSSMAVELELNESDMFDDEEVGRSSRTLLSARTLATSIRERKVDAIAELKACLATPGLITIHEFSAYILPALHEAIFQDRVVPPLQDGGMTPIRRTKKQRVGSFGGEDCGLKLWSHPIAFDRDSYARLVFGELISLSEEPHCPSDHLENSTDQNSREMIVHEMEGDTSVNTERALRKSDQRKAGAVPETVYMLLRILSFSERVEVLHSADPSIGGPAQPNYSSLQSLTEPIELELACWRPDVAMGSSIVPRYPAIVQAEPLAPLSDLQSHVLRTCRIEDAGYIDYSRRLVTSRCIIVVRSIEQVAQTAAKHWRVARVTNYNPKTGAHTVRYASGVSSEANASGSVVLHCCRQTSADIFQFEGETVSLILACLEYVIVSMDDPAFRASNALSSFFLDHVDVSESMADDSDGSSVPALSPGRRAETTAGSVNGSSWLPCTILTARKEQEHNSITRTRRSRAIDAHQQCYDVVTDDGEVHLNVSRVAMRTATLDSRRDQGEINLFVSDQSGNVLAPNMLHFIGERRQELNRHGRFPVRGGSGVLKRTWSAISPLQDMNSLDLNLKDSEHSQGTSYEPQSGQQWSCIFGSTSMTVFAEAGTIQIPPRLEVDFGASEVLPPPPHSEKPAGATVFSALCRLRRGSHQEMLPLSREVPKRQKLFYSIRVVGLGGEPMPNKKRISEKSSVTEETQGQTCNREEFDVACIQSMEMLNEMASYASQDSATLESDPLRSDLKLDMFQSNELTKKLIEQLDDSLVVVGNALPDWTLLGPSFAPRVFSYESRRLLLERSAFGVSRCALKQQETKVAVGPLRKRMAALRARAVELVGEAFSGGADDPTALQLQADELYGMEEALAARVQSAFRTQRWREHFLQCAKVSVRRDRLLKDTGAVMERYACDDAVRGRRLEVRFEGESGFDAASGEEAGVTRGFYADVAEALLSADHISPLHCVAPSCPVGFASIAETDSNMDHIGAKLPLWIPDMDSSRQVVIPTPRANPGSTIGVFPRPLSPFDPRLPMVLHHFRLIGRLFAAALRDSFMFPLPLSCAFLKLVQHVGAEDTLVPRESEGPTNRKVQLNLKQASLPNASNIMFAHMNRTPRLDSRSDRDLRLMDTILLSVDLPRPGFLGGEVFAVESYVCEALDRLDACDPPLTKSELEKRKREIASDRSFARVALGKSFDCTFEDYFEDRTFVDPLDPSQGDEAFRLCQNGHLRLITIDNVREWVTLAKEFILHNGILEQARAFRRGVNDFFPAEYLSVLTPEELQRDVCGSGDNVDRWDEKTIRGLFKLDGGTEALVAVAAIGGEGGASLSRRFGHSSPTIGFLIKALLESTSTQRRQFLSFVTSVPIETPGKIEVVPTVSASGQFMPMEDPSCLPRANTCARRLYLPKFDTYESFIRVLHAIIREESKFKGFYEWRG